MQRPSHYNTKNGKAIISYLASVKDSYVTAAQIAQQIRKEHGAISRPTVYRQLEKLVEEGKVRKFLFDGASMSSYQYIDSDEHEQSFPHLKCEVCNNLFNLDCDEVSHISHHISEAHAFQVNSSKTVFYGKCNVCMHSCNQE